MGFIALGVLNKDLFCSYWFYSTSGIFNDIGGLGVYSLCFSHYENMPIPIYRKFHLQKLKIFR